MGEVGGAVKKGRGVSQGSRKLLQGGGTGGTNFWLRDLDPFGSSGEEGRGHTQVF